MDCDLCYSNEEQTKLRAELDIYKKGGELLGQDRENAIAKMRDAEAKLSTALLQIEALNKKREEDLITVTTAVNQSLSWQNQLLESNRLNGELKNKIHDLQSALKFAADFIDPDTGPSPYSNKSIVVTLRKILAEYNICDCTVGSHLKDCKFAGKRIDEPDKCGVCGAPITDSHVARKEAWDPECDWHVCPSCKPKHTH